MALKELRFNQVALFSDEPRTKAIDPLLEQFTEFVRQDAARAAKLTVELGVEKD